MISSKLRGLAAAVLIGGATVGFVTVQTAVPAYAASVRPAVGKPLQEARSLADAGKGSAAMAKIQEAEGVPNKTAAESQIIEAMRAYVEAKSGVGPKGAQIKFDNDYNAGRYRDVIGPDADALRKNGVLNAENMRLVAQAYYLSGQKAECVHYIKDNFGGGAGEGLLQMLMRCAYDIGDDESMRSALEKLVATTGKPEYWKQLLKASERAKGLSDHQTLDIYRLKLLSGTMEGKDDYTLLAQLAIQLGFPGEAQNVIQKGMAANLMSDDRSKRLMTMAQAQAGQDAASMAKNLQAAQSAKNGDALVKLGEDLWGQGKYQDAIKTIQAGIAKGVTDPDNAQIRLGMAYLGAGQKDAAIRAFNAAKNNPNQAMIAHLWALYARK
jgi:tetratricopeptide (TPR) repeat protein